MPDDKTIVVVSNNQKIKNETDIYTALLNEGLDLLHIRKYGYPEESIRRLIEKIPAEFHKKLVLHSHYHLAKEMNLGGIHITRKIRKNLLFMNLGIRKYINNSNLSLSTSYHSTRKIQNSSTFYTYFFLNSLFGSILEGGKHAYQEPEKLREFLLSNSRKVVALGGIDLINIEQVKEIGFHAIGFHGAIWGFDNPLERFINLRDKFLGK